MTEIRFYHLERQPLERALPALLSKALSGGHKIIVRAKDEREVERLNEHLWTYNPDSFLPHGSQKDGFTEDQPIYLTAQDENPNGAGVLILTQGAASEKLEEFDLCCEMLDGRDEQAVSEARQRWKSYKEAGHDITYWQQSAQGWEKKSG